MIFDMHVHTTLSGDSSATVEDYCLMAQRYRQRCPLDGIVLTEHRVYHRGDGYRKIGDTYGITVLQGIEVNCDLGHLLIYGASDRLLSQFDISKLRLESSEIVKAVLDDGGIAVPAHPFRESRYGDVLMQREDRLGGIEVIEERNGSNTDSQNRQAADLMLGRGLKGIGGSDAHYANRNWFLNCATEFDDPIHTMDDLTAALRGGQYRSIRLNGSIPGSS